MPIPLLFKKAAGNIKRDRKDVRAVATVNESQSITQNPLNVYADNRVYNPDLLPATVQATYNNAAADLSKFINTTSTPEFKKTLFDAINEELKLNLNDEKDMQIFSDAMRVFNFTNKKDLEIESEENSIYFHGKYKNKIKNSTQIFLNPEEIYIHNLSFMTKPSTSNGVGYSMIQRQLAAARELSNRTNKPVNITVTAGLSSRLSGVKVWPKLGYDFPLQKTETGWSQQNYWARDAIKEKYKNIATEKELNKIKSTAQLMLNGIKTTQKDSSGNRIVLNGIDVWNEITKNAQRNRKANQSQLYGKLRILPNSNDLSLGEQVSVKYGQQKGFLKSLTASRDFAFDGSSMSSEEDNIFKNIWKELK